MRIAILTAFPVFPTNEGNRSRILTMARALAALGHEVHFVYLPSRTPDIAFDPARHVEEFGQARFHVLARPVWSEAGYFLRRFGWRTRRKLLQRMGTRTAWYFGLDELYFDGFTPQLRALHKQIGFGAVVAEYVFHSKALEAFPPGVRRILDTHDSFADRHEAFVWGNERRPYWFSIPPAEQERGFARADHVLAIQDSEADAFRSTAADRYRVWCLGHLLELGETVTDFTPVRGLYLGSNNVANVTSIETFITDVLPKVVAEVPEFRLVLAGRIGEAVADDPRIDKLGMVDRTIDAFRAAPLLVNYMRMGTGIGIKLLDALTAGVPVMSTKTGARGLPEAASDGVEIVDDADATAFADGLVRLLRSEALRADMGARAHRSAEAWNEAQLDVLRQVFAEGPA